MKILVTGSKGFVGKNLVQNLKEVRDGRNKKRKNLSIADIYEYDLASTQEELECACKNADFIFNFAGVNRTKEPSEFMKENFHFNSMLLNIIRKCNNKCPVMFSSSTQAALTGRFIDSEYGKSKLAAEELFFKYSDETGAKVYVYRFPNIFGKWCKPNYNSAVATFCNAVANDLDYIINDRDTKLELLYIDDLIDEMFDVLEGKEHHCEYDGLKAVPLDNGRYCYVPTTNHATLGEIIDLLESFRSMPSTLFIPEMPTNSFRKKLYSTYLSHLPKEKMAYSFKTNEDDRGKFIELIHTLNCGQISINITKPGMTRGQHWHNSKWEIFMVIFGHGLIQERCIGINPETDKEYPVIEFEVTGEEMRAIQILPGYTHNIINLSENETLITVIWTNELFDKNHPDTFYEPVVFEKE